ncbi:unnamed protein product [Closterium sp. Naga37s-1]|nr:unnamed protein product [Closterium sp. Naga37s-1]
MDVEESIDTRALEDYREALDSDATMRSRDVCSLNQHELGLLNRKSLRMGTGTSQGQKRPTRKFDLTLKPLPYEEVANRMMGSHVVSEKQRSKMKRHGTGRVKKRRPFGLRTPNFADDEEIEEEDEEIHAVFAKKDQPSGLGEDQIRLEDMLQEKAEVRAGSMVWNSLVLNPSGHTGNSRELAEATELNSEAPESVTHLNGSGVKNLHTAFEENGIGRVEVSESPVTDATPEVERDEAGRQANVEEKDHGAESDEPMSGSPQPTEVDSGVSEAMEGMMADGVSGAEQDADQDDEDDECHVVEIMCSEQISKKPGVSPLPAVVEDGPTNPVSDTVPTTPVAQQAPTVAPKSALKSGRKSARKSVRIAGVSGSPEAFAVLPLTPEAGSYLKRKNSSKVHMQFPFCSELGFALMPHLLLRRLCNRWWIGLGWQHKKEHAISHEAFGVVALRGGYLWPTSPEFANSSGSASLFSGALLACSATRRFEEEGWTS